MRCAPWHGSGSQKREVREFEMPPTHPLTCPPLPTYACVPDWLARRHSSFTTLAGDDLRVLGGETGGTYTGYFRWVVSKQGLHGASGDNSDGGEGDDGEDEAEALRGCWMTDAVQLSRQ